MNDQDLWITGVFLAAVALTFGWTLACLRIVNVFRSEIRRIDARLSSAELNSWCASERCKTISQQLKGLIQDWHYDAYQRRTPERDRWIEARTQNRRRMRPMKTGGRR